MTLTTGAGGNVGRPPIPLPDELDATANKQIMSMMLGITSESVLRPFEEIGQDATWNYKSSANNPTLTMLNRVRVAGATSESNAAWTATFQLLFNMLPAEVQARLLGESKLPVEERNSAYSALDATLGFTALALSWLDRISHPAELTALTASKFMQYADLPVIARQQLIEQGSSIIQRIQNNLTVSGPNDPNYDTLSGLANKLTVALNDFGILISQGDTAGLSQLAKELDQLQTQTQGRFLGDNLQTLGPMLWVLNTITAASALNTAAPALLLGLTVASLDLNKTLLPSSLNGLSTFVSELLLTTALPLADTGSRHLLPLLLNVLLGGAAALALRANPDGLLGLDLGMRLGVTSGVLQGICLGILQACGTDGSMQKTGVELLAGTVILTMLNVLASQNKKAAEHLAESLRQPLTACLQHLTQMMSDPALNLPNNVDKNALNVLFQQGELALENGDFEVFVDILLASTPKRTEGEIQRSQLKKEFKKFDDFVKILWLYTTGSEGNETAHNTGILQG